MIKQKHSDPITFVSINVWFGMDGRGVYKIGDYENQVRKNSRFKALIAGLTKISPDVVAIQEANKLPLYAAKISRDLNYNAVWKIQNSGVKIMGFGIPLNFTAGNVILAKKDHHLKYISSHRLSGKGIQFNCFSAHLKEIRNAMAAVVEICGQAILLFNTQTHFSLILEDKWEKAVDSMFDRIDFIFLSKHFSTEMIQRADLVFTEPAGDLFVSDHFGIQVVLNELPSSKK